MGAWRYPDLSPGEGAVPLDEPVEHVAFVAGQAWERAAGMVAVAGDQDGSGGLRWGGGPLSGEVEPARVAVLNPEPFWRLSAWMSGQETPERWRVHVVLKVPSVIVWLRLSAMAITSNL